MVDYYFWSYTGELVCGDLAVGYERIRLFHLYYGDNIISVGAVLAAKP